MKVRFSGLEEEALNVEVPLRCEPGVPAGQAFRNHRRAAMDAGFEAIRHSDYKPGPNREAIGIGGCPEACGLVALALAKEGTVEEIYVAPVEDLY